MSFKTLQQRYNEKVNDLYRGATTKFENGRPGGGTNADPLNPRRVGDESFGRISQAFGRFLPVARAFQDVLRITKFTFSIRGVTFLIKQGLLQTGNTFESTRLINPLFTIANAVPFLHVRRHLTPGALLSGLIGRTSTDLNNVQSMGQLQQGTYEKALGNPGTILGGLKSAFISKKNVGWPFPGANPPANFLRLNWATSRPELGTGAPETHIYTKQNRGSYVFKFGGRMESSWGAVYTNLFTYKDDNKYLKTDGYNDLPSQEALQRIPDYTFTAKRTEALSSLAVSRSARVRGDTIYDSVEPSIDTQTTANITTNQNKWVTPKFIKVPGRSFLPVTITRDGVVHKYETTFRDEVNERVPFDEAKAKQNDKFPYDGFKNELEDYITVKFQMGNGTPVPFRAYLKDLQQSVSPQYKEFQYVGRTEKFINYSGAQRETSFKLAVLAAHPNELKEVWKRINFLTGLTFPYAVSNGIYQPNIMKLTIGKVFVDQPVYVTSFNTNFSEVLESWDLDSQVPMAAQIDMKCIIIEKTQKVANSPFYGITEQYFKEEYLERVADKQSPGSAVKEVKG